MSYKSQKKVVKEKLQPFLENPIHFPEKILKQMDGFFETSRVLFTTAEQIYPVVKEDIFDVLTFATLIDNLENLRKSFEKLHQINKKSENFFQVLHELTKNPFKKVKKNPYLAKLKPTFWGSGHNYVVDSSFVSKSFYKLSYDPLNQLISNLEPLKPFFQTPNISNDHHPFTLKILTLIQEMPESVEECLSEIMPGVVYHELPPSISLYNKRSQEFSAIYAVFEFSKPNKTIYAYLKKVIKEYSLILDEYRKKEEEIKMLGFWKDKKGLAEFKKMMRAIKKYHIKFRKLGFFKTS
ncbi:MAG: hypothetical protein ACTSVZ_04560 [Promethearchaeota archaeon]